MTLLLFSAFSAASAASTASSLASNSAFSAWSAAKAVSTRLVLIVVLNVSSGMFDVEDRDESRADIWGTSLLQLQTLKSTKQYGVKEKLMRTVQSLILYFPQRLESSSYLLLSLDVEYNSTIFRF